MTYTTYPDTAADFEDIDESEEVVVTTAAPDDPDDVEVPAIEI